MNEKPADPPEAPRRLHPATLAIRFLEQLPQFVFGLPAIAYFATDVGVGMLLLIAFAGLVGAMLSAWIRWRRFSYETADEQLVIESGVFSRNRRTIPFDRIQDVSLEQNLLARIFGVSVVRIETGSSGSNEGKLDFVSREEADRLRDLIRAHRHGTAPAGRAEAAEKEGEARPPLFAMDLGRLLVFGLFSFSLVFLAILGGLAQYVFTWLPTRYADPEYYLERAQVPIAEGADIVEIWALGTSFAVAAAVLAAGVASGMVRVFSRDYGFRLTRTESGLRRERGLFTRTDVVIPLKRLQAAIVSTGIVRRHFGWQGLALQSLGSDGTAGTHHDAAPFARREELEPIFAEMAIEMPPPREAFAPISPLSPWHRAVFPALMLGAAATASAIFEPGLLIVVALAAIVAGLIIGFEWRARGYLLEARTLFVRKGVMKPEATILPLPKVQSVTVRQSLLQRIFGLASLLIGTAGAPRMSALTVPDLEREAALELRASLLEEAR